MPQAHLTNSVGLSRRLSVSGVPRSEKPRDLERSWKGAGPCWLHCKRSSM